MRNEKVMTKKEAIKEAMELSGFDPELGYDEHDGLRLERALAEHGFFVAPLVPTKMMLKAAYCESGVGDSGGAERRGFQQEYTAAVRQFVTNEEPRGLIELVRPFRG